MSELSDEVLEHAISYPNDLSPGNLMGLLKELKERRALALLGEAATKEKSVGKLPPLDEEMRDILGRPCFTIIDIANLLRKDGWDIKTKAEDEQACAIYWMLTQYFEHGENWRKVGNAKGNMRYTKRLKVALTLREYELFEVMIDAAEGDYSNACEWTDKFRAQIKSLAERKAKGKLVVRG